MGIKEIAEKVWLVTFMHYEFGLFVRVIEHDSLNQALSNATQ